MQRNSIYDDYKRRRERDRWRKRLPRLFVIAAAMVVVAGIGSAVLLQMRGQGAPAPQAALIPSATPGVMAVLPSATVEPTAALSQTSIQPTFTSQPFPTGEGNLTPVPTQAPLATQAPPISQPQPLPPSTGSPPRGGGSGQAGEGSEPDVPALQRLMLDLINADRQANGLTAVAWDESAAQAAMAHAEDMAAQGYFSHWNTKGWGPDVRYGLAGGTDVIRENVASQWRRYDDGRPAPIDDWSEVIREAQTGLMNSPGHRANILDPHHTHVGVGIAYNPQTGETRIAQEFIHRYIAFAPTTPQAGEVQLSGTLVNGASAPLINVAYEPLPKPLTPDELNNVMPRTYQSPAENIAVVRPEMQARDRFTARVPLGQNGAGLYHIRIWVEVSGEQVPAASIIIPIDMP